MLIDWFTVAAQVVNFLILMALLKFFLFDRVVRAMDEREASIRERIETAESKQEEAEHIRQEFHSKLADLDARREEEMRSARQRANEREQELVEEARKKAEATRKQWHAEIERERAAFLDQLAEEVGRQTLEMLEETAAALSGKDLQDAVVDRFLEHLGEANDEELAQLAERAKETGIVVRTPLEAEAEQKRRLTRSLHTRLGQKVDVRYETVPDLVMGVEVVAGNRRLGFDLRSRLDDMRDAMDAHLRADIQEPTKTASSHAKSLGSSGAAKVTDSEDSHDSQA